MPLYVDGFVLWTPEGEHPVGWRAQTCQRPWWMPPWM